LTVGDTMIKTPGRKPEPEDSPSRKSQLSSDAKIIIALIKNQPLTKEKICVETKISDRTFYRIISLLERMKIIRRIDHKYALWDFSPLETKIETAFSKLFKQTFCVTSDEIVNEIGMPWNEIESLTLKIAKKLDSHMETENGKITFYKPNLFHTT
jgi:hypothetical protein